MSRVTYNGPLSLKYLENSIALMNSRGFPPSQWMLFSIWVLEACKLQISLHRARNTDSKYLTVSLPDGSTLKFRFSNHMPIASREFAESCDFFVGVTHTGTRTTADAKQFLVSKLSSLPKVGSK